MICLRYDDIIQIKIYNVLLIEFEIKAIRAAAQVQQELKCPVSFHPGRNSKAPFEIMRLYTEAGGNANKAIMSHLDRKSINFYRILYYS